MHQRGVLDERVDAEHDKPLLVGALPDNDDVVNAHGFVWIRCKHYPGGHGLVVPPRCPSFHAANSQVVASKMRRRNNS